jgi:hypothetical protein
MGKKQARQRKHLLLYLAGCAALTLMFGGCLYYPEKWEMEEHLVRSKNYMSQGEFKLSLQESHTAYKLYPQSLGDQALFQIGLIYAHPANPQQNFQKAKEAFTELLRKYPQSSLKTRTALWILIIRDFQDTGDQLQAKKNENDRLRFELKQPSLRSNQLIEQSNQKIAANEQLIKDLQQRIDDLQRNIDQLKEVDLKIEEKKRKTGP